MYPTRRTKLDGSYPGWVYQTDRRVDPVSIHRIDCLLRLCWTTGMLSLVAIAALTTVEIDDVNERYSTLINRHYTSESVCWIHTWLMQYDALNGNDRNRTEVIWLEDNRSSTAKLQSKEIMSEHSPFNLLLLHLTCLLHCQVVFISNRVSQGAPEAGTRWCSATES